MDQQKLNTNNELLLKPSKTKQLRLLISSLVFVAVGVWMIGCHKAGGWFVLFFFALCVLIFVIKLLPGSTFLRLTIDGFEVRVLFRSTFYRWGDVQDFQVVVQYKHGIPIRTSVGFNFADTYTHAVKARALVKALIGCEGQLPDTYGMEAQKLTELMTQWKANAR